MATGHDDDGDRSEPAPHVSNACALDSLSVPATDINLRRILNDGQEKLDAARKESETAHAGSYRAGSGGCVVGDRVFGECPRIAHARWIGHDKPIEPNRKIMFAGGEGNEDLWEKVCVPGWQGQVLRGQRLKRSGGFGVVVGSPDIVLADERGQWRLVLELKLVCATNSAIYRELEGSPDPKHLVQSAIYLWLSGTPTVLCYTSRSDFAVEFQRKTWGVAKIEPFYRLFYLKLEDGRLFYRDEQKTNWVSTLITVAGIRQFYDMLDTTAKTSTLPPRPTNDSAIDGSDGRWDRCDAKYCAFSETCDRYEGDYVTWMDAVRHVCA